ncbi:MAG TPA: hypothetical protein VFM57_01440 [Thermoleophilaceae bacterium]|nr:hypothetical protein [Thermoleophilaceae bacterium]
MNPYGVRYSVGRDWGFTLLSAGLWLVFWFHRTRRLLDGELARGRDDAVLHSIGLVVPIWNIFVLYWLYRDLDDLRRWNGLPGLEVALYTIGGALAPVVTYSIALGKFNELWDRRTQGLAVEAPVSGGEKAVLAAGAALWLLWVGWIAALVFFELA